MDLNISVVNSNRENQLLSDVVRNKLEASATEEASFSPPKFNIPILKIPGNVSSGNTNIDLKNANTQSTVYSNSDSQLNQFLLKQLKEKQTHNTLCEKSTGFVMPELQSFVGNNKEIVKFALPVLKTQPTATSMTTLTNTINKLKVQEDKVKSITLTSATIDLTTALASKFETHQGTPPTRDLIKRQHHDELDFEIPFIDCDRLDTSRKHNILLPSSNEYCITDVSKILLHHSLTEPSAIGRFLSIDNKKYLDPMPLKYLRSKFSQHEVKHKIHPFNFDTKSPDDIVQLALSQNKRRHYN